MAKYEAIVDNCDNPDLIKEGYLYTVAIAPVGDCTGIVDFVDFRTEEAAEAYAEGFNDGQSYADC